MKIVKILGGLGNQMFQYALAIALKHKYPNETVKIDISCFKRYPLHQGYELSKIFKIDLPVATSKDLFRIAYPYNNYRLWQIGSRILPKRKGMLVQLVDVRYTPEVFSSQTKYLDGYWQSEQYFGDCKDIIRKLFTFQPLTDKRNLALIKKLNNSTSVSIHIRRGDYLKTPLYKGICDESYYRKAIDYIKARVKVDNFILFSNDIDWCLGNSDKLFGKAHIIPVTWNTGEDSYKDMQIMSLCDHNIIANSSFSWWGGWLNWNKNKIVICPSKWVNGTYNLDTIPKSWIMIEE